MPTAMTAADATVPVQTGCSEERTGGDSRLAPGWGQGVEVKKEIEHAHEIVALAGAPPRLGCLGDNALTHAWSATYGWRPDDGMLWCHVPAFAAAGVAKTPKEFPDRCKHYIDMLAETLRTQGELK